MNVSLPGTRSDF